MDDFGNFDSEALLAEASAWIFAMFGEDLVELLWHDESEVLEVICECCVGLVEPELVEVENAGLGAVEPDGVAFGFAEFAAGDFVDDERTGITVGSGVLETFDEMDTTGAVAVLVGATKLQSDVVLAIEMEEIITLDEGVAKFGVADARTTGTDALLNELTIEKLGHAENFANFAEERQELDVLEPIIIVENFGVLRRVGDADDLLGEGDFVTGDFVETFEVAFDGVFGVANLAGGATNKIIRGITMTHEAGAHHQGSEMTDVKTIGAGVGTPIEITWSFV